MQVGNLNVRKTTSIVSLIMANGNRSAAVGWPRQDACGIYPPRDKTGKIKIKQSPAG